MEDTSTFQDGPEVRRRLEWRAEALRLAGIGFDLLENLEHLVGLAYVHYRKIRHDTCDEQQAPYDVLHRNLPQANSVVAVMIHNDRENAIPDLSLLEPDGQSGLLC